MSKKKKNKESLINTISKVILAVAAMITAIAELIKALK